MEELLKNQKIEVDELLRLIRNYNSDSKSRKTERYLKDKLATFPELYRVIEENNTTINNLKQPGDEEQPYFKAGTFDQLDRLYQKAISDIRERLLATSTILASATAQAPAAQQMDGQSVSTTSVSDNGSAQNGLNDTANGSSLGDNSKNADGKDDILDDNGLLNNTVGSDESGTNILAMQYNDIMDLLASARDFSSETSHGLMMAHAANLNTMWSEFRSFYYQEKAAGKPISFSFTGLLQKFISVSGKLNDLVKNQNRPQLQNNEQSSNVQFNLPKLQLPEFNGKINEWKRFIALFDQMVHNNKKIDHGIKIEYLKTCVKGQAAKIINHIDPNPDNYTICYDLLRKRYDNKRELLGVLIDSILQLPKLKSENAEMLKSMHDTVYESIMSMANIGVPTHNWDPLLCHILTRKLDSSTHIHYECQLQDVREVQSLSNFLKYLENRFMALQSANIKYETQYIKTDNFSNKDNPKFSNDRQPKCLFCSGCHSIFKCDAFLKKKVEDRIEWARNGKMCLNCFSSTHKTHDCKSKFTCRTCSKKHNSVLHLEKAQEKSSNVKSIRANVSTTDTVEELHVARQNSGSVLLATIILGAFDKNGARILLRALLDQGSQSAFISETAAQTLKLSRQSISATVTGIGDKEQNAKHLMNLTIFPRFESDFSLNCGAIILPKLTKLMTNSQSKLDFEFIENLTLADPSFLKGGEIDMILGASEYAQIIKMGLMKSEKKILAQNTEFGWVLSGAVGINLGVRVQTFLTNIELNQSLQQFFRADEFNNENDQTEWSEEEKYCEDHYKKTIKRDENGRFVVTLPLKNHMLRPDLGDSRRCAVASLFQLARRFARNKRLGEEYAKFIAEGIELGHIEEAPFTRDGLIHYMPHHCVFKDSTTTALRVVYNGSQKTSNSKSLNEQLAIGKVHQRDIFSLLLRFRLFKYVFTADVEKMYKQILLNDEQMDLHRFVYRFSPDEPIKDFRLKTVTFGTANAPYLAIRTLQELAETYADSHPLASKAILSSMYMDDVLGGCHSLNDAIATYEQLKAVFSYACFNLRNWCCNSSAMLEQIPEVDREAKALNACVKALGISWCSKTDVFTYKIVIPLDSCPKTKRELTSEIASLFDPLGWIAPVMLAAKSIVQKLWKDKVDWDDPVDSGYITAWMKIKSEFHCLNELEISRWINFNPNDEMEIHGFSDASEIGFAAAVYLKNVTKNTVRLITAKAKVTPLKDDKNDDNITIPRLELCGAVLLSNLVKNVIDAFEFDFEKVYLWSDSKIVLSWIQADPSRYKSFIASRIRKINKLTDKKNWFHVPTECNPADCASRGLSPAELVKHTLWWHGPNFLLEKTYESTKICNFETDLGQQTAVNSSSVMINDWQLQDISTFDELKKRIALQLRKEKNENNVDENLTSIELSSATEKIIHLLQSEVFHEEITLLKKGKKIPKTNKYLSLSPFLDENGVLRVGGRLKMPICHLILNTKFYCRTNIA